MRGFFFQRFPTDDRLPFFRKPYGGGHEATTLCIGDENREAAFHHAHEGMSGSKIDSCNHDLEKIFPLRAGQSALGRRGSGFAESDAAFGEIVGRNFDGDTITRNNADEVLSHFSRDVAEENMVVGQLDPKKRSRKHIHYYSITCDTVVFGHVVSFIGQEGKACNPWANEIDL
jgi:hypothetical protein